MLGPRTVAYYKEDLIGLVSFLWHINHCRLFSAKSSLYINIYVWFVKILYITFLNESEHTVELFQVLLYVSHNLTSVICLQTVCPIWPYQVLPTGSEWTWEWLQWRGTPYSPNLRSCGASPSDGLMSYPGHLLGMGSHSSTDMQSLYSTSPVDWAV